jgi:hypothetical protein
MAGIGKQLRGSGIAKIQNRSKFEDGGSTNWEVPDYHDTNPDIQEIDKDLEKYKKGEKFQYRTPPHQYDSKGNIIPKPRYKKGGSANWIQGAIKKPGSLRKSLGVKKGEKIPAKKLAAAAKKPGKLGRRARLAETLRGLKK